MLFGLNFGLMDSTINIRLTGSSTESSAWLSYTAVACSCSSGISSLVSSLIVTISRHKSTLSSSFSYDQISLSSVQASNLRRWSSVGLSVIGVNIGGFGFSSRIRFGGSDSVLTSWISDTFVSCKLSPGFHENPQLVVTLRASNARSPSAPTFSSSEASLPPISNQSSVPGIAFCPRATTQ